MPVLVFDREGKFPSSRLMLIPRVLGNMLRCWGNKTPHAGTEMYVDPYGNKTPRFRGTDFVHPHAIEIDHQNNVWLIDDVACCITKCTREGELMTWCACLSDP